MGAVWPPQTDPKSSQKTIKRCLGDDDDGEKLDEVDGGGDDDNQNDHHDRDDDYNVHAENDDGNGDDSSGDDDPHTCDDVQGPYYDATACATIEAASVLSRTHSNRSRCSWS